MTLAEVLRRSEMFQPLEESLVLALENAMDVREYPDGHTFIREGEHGDTFYVIVNGAVRVTRKKGDGGTLELGTMGSGEAFGLLALITSGRRNATCTAVGRVTAASLPRGAFHILYTGDTEMAWGFQYLIARQLARDARSLNQALVRVMLAGEEAEPGPEPHSVSYDLRLSGRE